MAGGIRAPAFDDVSTVTPVATRRVDELLRALERVREFVAKADSRLSTQFVFVGADVDENSFLGRGRVDGFFTVDEFLDQERADSVS